MKLIPTPVHALLDYFLGVSYFAAPFVLGFRVLSAESVSMISAGAFLLYLAVFTRYEYGVWKKIPMGLHILMEIMAAVFLMACPWLFQFSNHEYIPHLIIGGIQLIVAVLSTGKSSIEDRIEDVAEMHHQVPKDGNVLEEGYRKN